jgi:hypothetical protein
MESGSAHFSAPTLLPNAASSISRIILNTLSHKGFTFTALKGVWEIIYVK